MVLSKGFGSDMSSQGSISIPYQGRLFYLPEGGMSLLMPTDWPPSAGYIHKFKYYDYRRGLYRIACSICAKMNNERCAFCNYGQYGFKSNHVAMFSAIEFSIDDQKPIDLDLKPKEFVKSFCTGISKCVYHINSMNRALWEAQHNRRKEDLKYAFIFVQRVPSDRQKSPATGNVLEYLGRLNKNDAFALVRSIVERWDSMASASDDEIDEKTKVMMQPYDFEKIYPILAYEDVVKAMARDEIKCYFDGLKRVMLSREDKELVHSLGIDYDENGRNGYSSDDVAEEDEDFSDEVPF